VRGKGRGLIVAEEKTAVHLAGSRHHRHCQIADYRQVAFWHTEVRGVLAITWIGANIIGANDTGAAKSGREDCGIAGQPQGRKHLSRSTRKGIKQVAFTRAIDHIVEEGAELRAAKFGGNVGHSLDDAFEVKVSGDGFGKAIEGLEAASLIAQGLFGLLASGDNDVPHQVIQDLGDRVAGGNSGERSPLIFEQRKRLCLSRRHIPPHVAQHREQIWPIAPHLQGGSGLFS
jgi:hypothetical protein